MMDRNLAQINIAKMLAPLDSPVMADFVGNLDRINARAEKSPGFVWRLVEENNNAISLNVFNDNFLIVNMSVWKSRDDLFNFTYQSDHRDIFKRKKEWFSKMKDMHMAFWYVKNGSNPTPDEAKERLRYLNEHGETPYAFTFKSGFSPEDAHNYKPSN